MGYGDNLTIDGITHIENHDGERICKDARGIFVSGDNYCLSCRRAHRRDQDMLKSWIDGKGLSRTARASQYTPGQSWDWNSPPGFDKNRKRKRR